MNPIFIVYEKSSGIPILAFDAEDIAIAVVATDRTNRYSYKELTVVCCDKILPISEVEREQNDRRRVDELTG